MTRLHTADCDVTKGRAELDALLAHAPNDPVLLGALVEYEEGGDQEVEACTCGAVNQDEEVAQA